VLPAAAKLYEKFDKQLTETRNQQLATDAKAEGARTEMLQQVSDRLAIALADAQRARRDADVAAFEQRRKTEEDAEREFILALAAAPARPSFDAQKIRAQKMEKAKIDFDAALAASQKQFAQSRDAALAVETFASRNAEQTFKTATKVNALASRAALASAEQALVKGLSELPEAAVEFQRWTAETEQILADYKRSENEEFERFHQEVQALRGSHLPS